MHGLQTGMKLRGWGIRVFKIESSDTSAVPLSLRLTGEVEASKESPSQNPSQMVNIPSKIFR